MTAPIVMLFIRSAVRRTSLLLRTIASWFIARISSAAFFTFSNAGSSSPK